MIYTAITIGPIFKTIMEAKKTRAVWAASYYFSWFARRVLEEALDANMQVFLPDTSGVIKDENGKHHGIKGYYGAGLYADRLYFINDKNTNKEKLWGIVQDLYTEIASQLNIQKSFIKDYMNVHIIEKTITNADLVNDFPLAILNDALDNSELHQNFNFKFNTNPLQVLFNSKTNQGNFLAVDAFEANNQRIFKSVGEIATASFSRDVEYKKKYHDAVIRDLKSEGEVDLIEELKIAKIPILPVHKYFAIIYADGDNIGTLLKKVNEKNKDVKDFSNSIFDFGLAAEKTIADYGGSGIYLGGEDVLAFAPIVCLNESDSSKQSTVFDLIQKLDEDFEKTVKKYAEKERLPIPTLSFGLMIAYFKHPLKEIMSGAYECLEDVKKSSPKNGIKVLFQKHSGHRFECLIDKNAINSAQQAYKIIHDYCQTPVQLAANTKNTNNQVSASNRTDEILSSIIQKFRDDVFIKLFAEAAKKGKLTNLFENSFNEKIHTKPNNLKAVFLKRVKEFAETIYAEYDDKNLAIKSIFALLRFIHFVNSKKDN
ncbi:MAG: type III-B CRISPR-associated protein Cas10/Cmr2 [Arcobacteraceae bacterium]|nr:type III-B CRISPR-associated protein Cas10/Cmr2 [Arcobacteraceae bacterium]